MYVNFRLQHYLVDRGVGGRAISLPVNQVLESPALRSNTQEVPHCVCQIAADKTGDRSGPGNRRIKAVRQRFNSRYMESGMYMEGAGQQKMNSSVAKDFRDGERAN